MSSCVKTIYVTNTPTEEYAFSSIEMRPLSPTLAKIAFEELSETPDRIQQDLIILRVWIKQQPHLRARTSDEFLIAFLRRCKYSLEETKKRIECFFSFYKVAPEFFKRRRVNERILDINRLGIHFYPEYPKCNNQMALLISRFGCVDFLKYKTREIMQFSTMAMEIIALENDNATVAGICQIIDFVGLNTENMKFIDRNVFGKWLCWIQDCCPLQIKEAYLINLPKDIERMVNFRRFLMPWKLDIPIIVKSLEELYRHIPQKCLPEEYGGTNGHVAECIAYMEDQLKSYRSYFQEDHQYGIIEELRKSDVVTYELGFGASGSFRKLETD